MNNSDTELDRLKRRLLNNKVIATLVLVFVVGAALTPLVKWSYPLLENWLVSTEEKDALRIEIQGIQQVNELALDYPTLSEKRVYCEAARFTLLLARPETLKQPIKVHSIKVESRPMPGSPQGKCAIDPLSRRPYGIAETETFVITSNANEVVTKYIKDKDTATLVESNDLLKLPSATRVVDLDNRSETITFDVIVEAKSDSPHEVSFKAIYDHNGEKTSSSEPVVVWK